MRSARRLALLLPAFLGLALPLAARAGDDGAPKGPAKVVVGAYVDRITDMSLRENRFRVDMYVWFRWTDGALDPLKTFDVVDGNVTSRTGEVREEHGDFHYASCRVEAEITQFFDVARYPFDDHVLRVEIEDTEKEAEFVEYVPDAANSGCGAEVRVPGWTLGKPAGTVTPHRYATNYGNVDLPTGDASVYSQYVLAIPLHRAGVGYFLKLFFGLFIAVGIALLAFHIKPSDLDPRFGLPVGAIFAAVGSLYVTSGQLPDTSSLTLADRLHILAFGVIFVTLIESTISLKLWGRGEEERSQRLDRIAFRALAALYVAGTALAVVVS